MRVSFIIAAIALVGAAQATEYTFSIGATVIPGEGVTDPSPLIFNVSGLDGVISSVRFRFNGLTHFASDDIGALLFDPTGTGTILFDGPGGADTLDNVNWLFDDAAAATLSDAGSNPSGTYRPGQNQWQDVFTGAPVGPYSTSFSVYNGTSGIGDWRLFVEDFIPADAGEFDSADLLITTTPVPEPATLVALGVGAVALLRRRRKV